MYLLERCVSRESQFAQITAMDRNFCLLRPPVRATRVAVFRKAATVFFTRRTVPFNHDKDPLGEHFWLRVLDGARSCKAGLKPSFILVVSQLELRSTRYTSVNVCTFLFPFRASLNIQYGELHREHTHILFAKCFPCILYCMAL